jgi:hypothetical protein
MLEITDKGMVLQHILTIAVISGILAIMARRLKVWYMPSLHVWDATPAPNSNRQVRGLVAVSSRRRAAECFGVSEYQLTTYGNECVKPEDIELAIKKPETVFWFDEYGDKKWHEMLPTHPDYSKFAIWWLSRQEAMGAQHKNCYPLYIKREIQKRDGNPGNCLLWVPRGFKGCFEVHPWNYNKWRVLLRKKRRAVQSDDHGGIVILRCDVPIVRKATRRAIGFFTDFKLNLL